MKHQVSVVLYTHNNANSLEQAIEDVVTKCDERIELVIIDDASNDKTAGIVGMLSIHEKYRGMTRVISHMEEEGKLKSWEEGVKAARAPYVFCMEARDNVVLSDLLALVEQAQDAGAEIACPTVIFSEDPQDPSSEVLSVAKPPEKERVTKDIANLLFSSDAFEPRISGWLFSRELLLHSFAAIDEEDLVRIHQSGITFIASTRAHTFITCPNLKPLVALSLYAARGRGVEVFDQLCQEQITLTICEAYLKESGLFETYHQAFLGLSLMLCSRACRLFPKKVPSAYWAAGAEMLLNSWGASAVATSYAHMPQASLSEVAIALASGLPELEARKVERVVLLVQDQEQLLDAIAYSDKLTRARKSVSFILEEDIEVSTGLHVACRLAANVFNESRAHELIRALERQHADALVVFAQERRFAYDMLIARAEGVSVGLVCDDGYFNPRRFLELLPQVAFANAVVSANDIECELWSLLDVGTSTLNNLASKLAQKTRKSKHLSSRELVFTMSRLAFAYLRKSALLADEKAHAGEHFERLQKDLAKEREENKELEQELFKIKRERDEYKGFYEGRLSRRIVAKRLGETEPL